MSPDRQVAESLVHELQKEAELCGEMALAAWFAENHEQVAALWLANPRTAISNEPDNPFQYALR